MLKINEIKVLFDIEDRKNFSRIIPLMIFGLVLEIMGIALVPIFIKLIKNSSDINKEYFFYQTINENQNLIILLGASFILIFLISRGFIIFKISKCVNEYIFYYQGKISQKVINYYLDLGWNSFRLSNPQVAIKNITNEVQEYVINFSLQLIIVIVEITFIFVIFVAIFAYFGYISLIQFCILGIGAIYISRLMKPIIKKIGEERFKSNEIVQEILKKIFYGMREIYVFKNLRELLMIEYQDVNKLYTKSLSKLFTYIQIPRLSLDIFLAFSTFIIVLIGYLLKIETYEIISTLIVFMIAGMRILPGINKIISGLQNIYYAEKSKSVILEILQGIQKQKLLKNEINHQIKNIWEFKLENLNIGYKEKLINKNINLRLVPGNIITISGKSGVGKSTLADTIMGLHQPLEGSLIVNNIPLKLIEKNSFIDRVGYVSQNIYIFDESLTYNIALGRNLSELSDGEIQKLISLLDTVGLSNYNNLNLKQKLGTSGVVLSGGQSRRLALARALWKEPDILILDELTSGLDYDSEMSIVKLIKNLDKKIIILITHSDYLIAEFKNNLYLK